MPLVAKAAVYSDEVSLESESAGTVTLIATATDSNKKEAEQLAVRSAFNALFQSGVEGLKNGQPIFSALPQGFEYRFFNENRFLNYLTDQPKVMSMQKVMKNSRVTMRVSINLKSLLAAAQRQKMTLNPAWADKGKVSATASFNPTIVVVPYVDGNWGHGFEGMRNRVEASPVQRFAVDKVAEMFQKNGYKTRDFISRLENAKTDMLLREDNQTDVATMIVQQLPGDIVVTVEATPQSLGQNKNSVSVSIRAVEKQTNGRLASKSFESGPYLTNDTVRLTGYAISKISPDFFSQLSQSFKDVISKGREVELSLSLGEAVSDWDFDQDSPASGAPFKEALEEWLRTASFQSAYDMSLSTDKFVGIRLNVPLWDYEKNRSYTLSNFSSDLRKFLKTQLGDSFAPAVKSLGQKIEVTLQ